MRKAAILASICIGVSATDVHAYDVQIKSRLNQTLEANDNYQLQSPSLGWTYPTVSTLVLDALIRTPTMRFIATGDVSYRAYFGPGADALLPGTDRGASANLEKKLDKLTTVNVGGSFRIQNARAVQLEETGISTIGGGDIITSVIQGGFQRQVTARDVIAGSAVATSREFTSPTGTPSTDLSTAASWIHQFSQTLKMTPSLNYQVINQQNASNTQIETWRGQVALESELTKRLSFRGGIGAVYLKLTQTGSTNLPNPTIPLPPLDPSDPLTDPADIIVPGLTNSSGSGSAVDWVGDFRFSYKINTTNTVSLAGAQSVGPDTLGTVRKTQLLGVVWNHAINHHSNLIVAGDVSRQLSAAAASDLYTAAITYSQRLAREWNMALTYRFRQRITEDSSAHSNSVVLVLSRDFTILPGTTERGSGAVAPDSTTALMASPAIWAVAQRSLGR